MAVAESADELLDDRVRVELVSSHGPRPRSEADRSLPACITLESLIRLLLLTLDRPRRVVIADFKNCPLEFSLHS